MDEPFGHASFCQRQRTAPFLFLDMGKEIGAFLIVAELSDRIPEITVEDMILRFRICSVGFVNVRNLQRVEFFCEHFLGRRTGQLVPVRRHNIGRREMIGDERNGVHQAYF